MRSTAGMKLRSRSLLISWAAHQMDEADQGHHSDRAGGHRVSVDERLWARAPDRAGRSDLVAWPMINKEGSDTSGDKQVK